MTDSLTELADRLGDVLTEETALLDGLHLAAAGQLLPRKRAAFEALQVALAAQDPAAGLDAAQMAGLKDSLQAVGELADVNRQAIERGLALQMRLIQAIARAVPRARATQAPIYQPNGSQLPPRPPEAYAFLSRM